MTTSSHYSANVRSQIDDATGFDNGDAFESEQQVREYFTQDSMRSMFVEWDNDNAISDDDLARWAEIVIEERWNCEFA